MKTIIVITISIAFISCTKNGRNYDWGVSCSEIERNFGEISKIENRLERLQYEPENLKTSESIKYLKKRKRMLLLDNDNLQQDCRPIYRGD
jgi:hypothetical protein